MVPNIQMQQQKSLYSEQNTELLKYKNRASFVSQSVEENFAETPVVEILDSESISKGVLGDERFSSQNRESRNVEPIIQENEFTL